MSERSDLRDGVIAFVTYASLLILSVLGTPLTLISMGLLPLPALVFTAKHTRKAGLVLGTALLAMSFFLGLFWTVMTLMCVGAGWGMGQFHHSGRHSVKRLLLTGTVTLVAGFFVLLALLSVTLDFNLVQELERQWTTTTAVYQQIWDQMGIRVTEEELLQVREMMVSLLPFVFLTTAGSIVLVNHGIARLILRRLDVSTVQLPPFREWVFPRSLLAWYIMSVIVSVASQTGTYWYSVGLTATWLIQLLFVVQALALLTALIHRFVRLKAVWLICLAVLFLPIIVMVLLFLYVPLSFLGMLDIGFRFRDKLRMS